MQHPIFTLLCSVKQCLKKILGIRRLEYEEMLTIIKEKEILLNNK